MRKWVPFHKEFMHGKTKIVILEFQKELKERPGKYKKFYSMEISVDDRVLIKKHEPIGWGWAGSGKVLGAGISDLDADGDVEIYISLDSGSNVGFIVFQFFELVGDNLVERNSRLFNDFIDIEITKTHIINTKPRWKIEDATCCPSGGWEIKK